MFVFLAVCLFVCLCDIHSSFHDCCYFHYFRFFSCFNMVRFFSVRVCARVCVSVCFYGNFPPLMSLGSLDAIDFIGFFFFSILLLFLFFILWSGASKSVYLWTFYSLPYSQTQLHFALWQLQKMYTKHANLIYMKN